MDFNIHIGTAVYLFGVTSQNDTGTIEFTLDGRNGTTYNSSVGVPQVVHAYNISFFSASGLANGSHTLGFRTVLALNSSQTVLIDYAVVTVDNSTDPVSDSGSTTNSNSTSHPNSSSGANSQPDKSPKRSALIGGAVGGIVAAALLVLAMCFLVRLRKTRVHPVKAEDNIQPYPVSSQSIACLFVAMNGVYSHLPYCLHSQTNPQCSNELVINH